LYPLGFLLFVAALLSKTVSCSLPAALLIVLWWKRGRLESGGAVARIAPLFAAGAGLAFLTVWIEKHHVGAQGVEWALSLPDRVLIAGRAIWFYAASLMWPHRLTFIYPRWAIDASSWRAWLFPLAVAIVIAVLWLARARTG